MTLIYHLSEDPWTGGSVDKLVLQCSNVFYVWTAEIQKEYVDFSVLFVFKTLKGKYPCNMMGVLLQGLDCPDFPAKRRFLQTKFLFYTW